MVDDPPLFMTMGVHPFWLYVPRLVMAIAVVRLIRLWQGYDRRSRSTA